LSSSTPTYTLNGLGLPENSPIGFAEVRHLPRGGTAQTMHDIESPIEISVNVQRFLMDRVHGVLELQFTNLAKDEPFTVLLTLTGRLLPKACKRTVRVKNNGIRTKSIALSMNGEAFGSGSPISTAGDARFDVDMIICTAEGERHRFSGEFVLTVLEYAQSMQQVNVNINKVIEQHDKGGMGAINEIDLSNLIKMPSTVDVNSLIDQDRTARFVPIELEYEGEVEPETTGPALIERDVPAMHSATITPVRDDDAPGPRLLVMTKHTLVLGRSRQNADLVTWVMPRSEQNDYDTRKISGRHTSLRFTGEGIFLTPISKTNKTSIDGKVVRGETMLNTESRSVVSFSSVFELTITPVPLPHVPDSMWNAWREYAFSVQKPCWDWSRQHGVGGFFIERTDGLAEHERYLWLLSMVGLEGEAVPAMSGKTEAVLMALPRLAVGNVSSTAVRVNENAVRRGAAFPLANADACLVEGLSWRVTTATQWLEVEGASRGSA